MHARKQVIVNPKRWANGVAGCNLPNEKSMVRLASAEHLAPLPRGASLLARVQHDVDFVARFLSATRNRPYRASSVQRTRNASPRYRAEITSGGAAPIIAEWQELLRADLNQASASLTVKGGLSGRPLRYLSSAEIAAAFRVAIIQKTIASELEVFQGLERVLLLRNRVEGTTESTYLRMAVSLDDIPVEHGFMIARGRLLELW